MLCWSSLCCPLEVPGFCHRFSWAGAQSGIGIGREEQGRKPCARPAGSAARTESGGGEARGPCLGQPGRRSWEDVPGGEWAGNPPALEREDSLGLRPSVCCQPHPAPQHPKSRPETNLRHSFLWGSPTTSSLSLRDPLPLASISQGTERVRVEAGECQGPSHPLQRPPSLVLSVRGISVAQVMLRILSVFLV